MINEKVTINNTTFILALFFIVFSTLYFSTNNKPVNDFTGVVLIEEQAPNTNQTDPTIDNSILGTGIIIGENKILTNYHVAHAGTNPKVYAYDSVKEYKAEIVEDDALTDIAIIKLTEPDWTEFKKRNNYSIMKIKSAKNLNVGDRVYTIGHPWGLAWTFSSGVVSAVKRKNDPSPRYMIQTDARIYQGNSGGPLLDEKGYVVGMNTQMLAKTGGSYGFSIPGEILLKVIHDLDTNKKVTWPVLGIAITADVEKGYVLVDSVDPTKSGAKSGVRSKDILISIDGVSINTQNDILTYLAPKNVDDIINLVVNRNNKLLTITTKLDGKLSSEYPQPDYSE